MFSITLGKKRLEQRSIFSPHSGCSLEGMMLKLNSSTLATSCEELTHWKRLWCWEGLGAGGKGANRGWDGWMASPTWWMWVWVNSRRWWWTGRPDVLQFMGSQRVRHDWATELNWTDKYIYVYIYIHTYTYTYVCMYVCITEPLCCIPKTWN